MTVDAMPSTEHQADTPVVTIEIWSDVVCPWCYIGKRRFATGLEATMQQLAADGIEVDFDISYHPYQLDPTAAPGSAEPVVDAYAKKFGGIEKAQAIIDNVTNAAAEAGIEFNMGKAQRANTLLAHRLIWLAAQPESPVAQDAIKERLLQAYFTDGSNIGDPDTLADCAAEVGFDRDQIIAFLASDRGVTEVAEELRFAQANGISAVPTYVINRQWAVPGAQDPETFVQVLTKMAAQAANGESGETDT